MNCKKCNAENDMDCESKCWKCGERLQGDTKGMMEARKEIYE